MTNISWHIAHATIWPAGTFRVGEGLQGDAPQTGLLLVLAPYPVQSRAENQDQTCTMHPLLLPER